MSAPKAQLEKLPMGMQVVLLLGALALAAFPFIPLTGGDFYLQMVSQMMILAIFAMSLDLLQGEITAPTVEIEVDGGIDPKTAPAYIGGGTRNDNGRLIITSVRRVVFHLSSSCPYQPVFRLAAARLVST